MRSILINLRKSLKLIILFGLAFFIIFMIMYLIYRPVYIVKLNGETLGYIEDKSKLQDKINEYMSTGDNEDIAFVEFDTLPEYETCFSRKDNETSDDKVLDTVLATGTAYYKYYAILEGNEEKYYVKTYEEAENVINALKEKKSTNIDSIKYNVKYETEQKEFSDKDKIVAGLFKEPVVQKQVTTPKKTTSSATRYAATGSVNTAQTVSYSSLAIGTQLIRPVSGTITSRFGRRSSGTHTGLDIATSLGTPIGAAAAGTVSYAGWKGSYGNLVVIDHGNGVQTYYAHCSAIYVSAGTPVAQGQTISAVGSTGNSTGPHLHLEVRVNGVCQNPQNYVY